MNRKPWIASVSGMAIASLVLVVSPANASDYAYTSARNKPVYDYARVVEVEPVIRYVTVGRTLNTPQYAIIGLREWVKRSLVRFLVE